jgi:hypothetical protein
MYSTTHYRTLSASADETPMSFFFHAELALHIQKGVLQASGGQIQKNQTGL